jgi:hypothetical protein
MPKSFFALFLILLVSLSAFAQEVLTIPGFSPAIANTYSTRQKSSQATNTIKLPFYDDFSVISVYPSPLRWADEYVFVNTDYAKFPPTIGVATLDALDETGSLYSNAGPIPFDADYLTSLPIRLDSVFSPSKEAITLADPVVFSFYYQPQGRTISPPSKKASLILEFHSPGDNDTITTDEGIVIEPIWNEIWSTVGGVSVDTFAFPDSNYFRQVVIPLNKIQDSTLYYKNGFQFRFRNIAALAGNSQSDWRNNGSHWNIDLVWLNVGLPVQKDIAFGDIAPSMLVNYESMPFRQYLPNFINEMKDSLNIYIANLDNVNQNVSYRYDASKSSGEIFATWDPGGFIVKPFQTDWYCDYRPFSRPPVNFFFPASTDEKIVFHITHTLTPDPNPLFRSNDSTQFDQLFSNYYAYDNGTSEAGIGINGAAGAYAVQFKLNIADTVRGMQIYFNPVVGGTNQKIIDLQVWNDAFGKPGQIIKTLSGVTPIYSENLNEFTSYWFEEPLVVNSATFPGMIFYIGWTQSFVDNLNVGFDRYKDSYSKRFFNVDGNWEMSSEMNYGSLMMRPIVGPANPLNITKPNKVQQLSIFPNPVSDGTLVVQLPEVLRNTPESNLDINIISASGSCILSGSFSNPMDVSSLAPGFYLVLLTDKSNGYKATGKLIIK